MGNSLTSLQLCTLDLVSSPDSQGQEETVEGRAESETRRGSTEASRRVGLMSFVMMAQEKEQ